MAAELGADDRFVAFMQYFRVLVVVLLTPVSIAIFFPGHHSAPGAVQSAPTLGDAKGWLLAIALGVAGALAARLVRMTAGALAARLVRMTAGALAARLVRMTAGTLVGPMILGRAGGAGRAGRRVHRPAAARPERVRADRPPVKWMLKRRPLPAEA